VLLHNAKANSRIGLDFLLQIFGKLFVVLGCDNSKGVHFKSAHPLAMLINAKTQAAANSLTTLALSSHFT
jgi:hypothetical protein